MSAKLDHPDDWQTVVDDFRWLFQDRRRTQMLGRPGGTNHLTREFLGFIDIAGTTVEVSTGMGIDGGRIFGVTWPRGRHGIPDERDCRVGSLGAILELAERIEREEQG